MGRLSGQESFSLFLNELFCPCCVLTAGSLPLQNGQAAPEEGGNPPAKVKMLWGYMFKLPL